MSVSTKWRMLKGFYLGLLFGILQVPIWLSSKAKLFWIQQLGPELLQKWKPGHVPFPLFTYSLTHWAFRSVLAAVPWCSGAVKGLQLSSRLMAPNRGNTGAVQVLCNFGRRRYVVGWISLPYSSQSYRIACGFPHVMLQVEDVQVGLKLLFLRKICLYVACAPYKVPARCSTEFCLWCFNRNIYW